MITKKEHLKKGKDVEQVLKELEVNQTELSERIGMTPQHMSKLIKKDLSLKGSIPKRIYYSTLQPIYEWNIDVFQEQRSKEGRKIRYSMNRHLDERFEG